MQAASPLQHAEPVRKPLRLRHIHQVLLAEEGPVSIREIADREVNLLKKISEWKERHGTRDSTVQLSRLIALRDWVQALSGVEREDCM